MYYERPASFKWEVLKKHLREKIVKWQDILNKHYKTDVATDLTDYAKGSLTAYIELLSFVEGEEQKSLLKKTV
jgi:hypothetical protein